MSAYSTKETPKNLSEAEVEQVAQASTEHKNMKPQRTYTEIFTR